MAVVADHWNGTAWTPVATLASGDIQDGEYSALSISCLASRCTSTISVPNRNNCISWGAALWSSAPLCLEGAPASRLGRSLTGNDVGVDPLAASRTLGDGADHEFRLPRPRPLALINGERQRYQPIGVAGGADKHNDAIVGPRAIPVCSQPGIAAVGAIRATAANAADARS